MKEQEMKNRYYMIREIDVTQCYMGGKWCATCMYARYDDGHREYEHPFCVAVEKEKRYEDCV